MSRKRLTCAELKKYRRLKVESDSGTGRATGVREDKIPRSNDMHMQPSSSTGGRLAVLRSTCALSMPPGCESFEAS